ncbi:NAD binding domain of 6-phosphogluconate dehydrogenase [Bacillus sp. OV166]|nr:NAD binding domain of 6-phosphogluconate dehydrogenase [Bacillus sp. OV166]
MNQQQVGVIGLADLGKDIALNIESRGFSVSVYSHSSSKTKEFIKKEAKGKRVVGTYSISEFVHSLKKPRNTKDIIK